MIAVLLVTTPAAADSYDVVNEYDDNPWHDGHVELVGGIAHRDAQLGGLAIHGREASLGLGWRRKRLTTELAYAFGILPAGATHQLAVRERYSIGVIGGYTDSLRRGDGWVELGAGVERFHGRDAATRTALSFGFGADLGFGNATYDGSSHHYLGARLAVRLTAALAPDDDQLRAFCTGDCGAPRDPIDLGIVVSASVVMGR